MKKICIMLLLTYPLALQASGKSSPSKTLPTKPNKQTANQNHNARVYYKPVTAFSNATKDAKSIGMYQRSAIGNDGAYGVFTQKGKTLSQTVLEHNPTNTPIIGVTDKPAIGYIQNTNPGAGSLAGAPSYLELYRYNPSINLPKKAVLTHRSMPMKRAQYSQKK